MTKQRELVESLPSILTSSKRSSKNRVVIQTGVRRTKIKKSSSQIIIRLKKFTGTRGK